jgi:hypothetical protein
MMKSRSLDLRDSPLDPKRAAAFGPRDLKAKGSFEWTVQTTSHAQGIWVSLDRNTKDWLRVVAEIDECEVWKTYPPEKPYGTRDAYFRGEFGQPEPILTRLKEAQQLMVNGGDRKSEAFERQQLQQHGGDRKSGNQFSITKLKSVSARSDAAYIRARLERDGHTELLAKIERGDTSAHAVAVELGWRARMVQVAPTVDGFRRAVERYLSAEQQTELSLALRPPTQPPAS